MVSKKTVIVTGGSSGMGKAIAKKFIQEGANVVITGRHQERLNEAKQEPDNLQGGYVHTISMDVRQPEDVQRMVQETVEQFGTFNHLVNNAAGNFIASAEDLSINGWNAVIDIVLNGTFYCSREAGTYWIEKGMQGSILNMTATYAWNAGAGVAHSSAAKAGVLNLTRTLAIEWGRKYGIRVNAIAPGPIERTGGSEKLFQSNEALERTVDAVPLRRLGKPEEIADLAYFLLSDKAAFINGEVVTMDGGQWLNEFPF